MFPGNKGCRENAMSGLSLAPVLQTGKSKSSMARQRYKQKLRKILLSRIISSERGGIGGQGY
jgi:hypothetical protein